MQIEAILSNLEIQFVDHTHRHGRAGWIQVCCPDCDSGEKYHLGIRLKDLRANCWQCGPKSLPKVLTQLSSISWRDAQSALRGILPSWSPSDGKSGRKSIAALPERSGALQERHREYLRARGFRPSELSRVWGIKGLGHHKETAMRWRVVIPILYQSRLVSWTARSVIDHRLRYISCSDEAVPHKSILFGWDYVSSAAILHEGPLDAMATGPGAVASFGTSFMSSQVAMLGRLKRLVICYDSQKEAQKQAAKVMEMLEPFPVEVFNVTIDAKDPADALRECPKELKLLRRLAFGRGRE